ncbi:S26 family signal peptidase [Luedemannella helvata]|uniref:Mitochondrial inner membrane protease subunit 2 n=1 Tax=Luedemannella helvata TaxID=349315 RepID=A0ABP4XAR0_9ACTN
MTGVLLGAGVALAAASLVAVSLVRRRWTAVRVRGGSMAPTLRDGDLVLARRRDDPAPRRGDIVVLRRPAGAAVPAGAAAVPDRVTVRPPAPPRRWLIKRVAAVAGDPVPPDVPCPAGTVPAGMVVVLGDSEGFDSRLFGPVAVGSIHATVTRTMRPPGV